MPRAKSRARALDTEVLVGYPISALAHTWSNSFPHREEKAMLCYFQDPEGHLIELATNLPRPERAGV